MNKVPTGSLQQRDYRGRLQGSREEVEGSR